MTVSRHRHIYTHTCVHNHRHTHTHLHNVSNAVKHSVLFVWQTGLVIQSEVTLPHWKWTVHFDTSKLAVSQCNVSLPPQRYTFTHTQTHVHKNTQAHVHPHNSHTLLITAQSHKFKACPPTPTHPLPHIQTAAHRSSQWAGHGSHLSARWCNLQLQQSKWTSLRCYFNIVLFSLKQQKLLFYSQWTTRTYEVRNFHHLFHFTTLLYC